jgi:DNA phosphorothioation-associated putative methyltransferase
VNLGYVLNVVEDPAERHKILVHAYGLASQVLVVAVRVDRSLEGATDYGDGFLTNARTFQKIYGQSEFREYLERVLARRINTAALGIAYVFKDEQTERRYLANRAFTRRLEYRTDLIEQFAKSAVAGRFVRLANKLGRMPTPEEFTGFPRLVEVFGSPQRIERLTLRYVNQTAFDGSRAQRREDILAYFAMLQLQGLRPPPIGVLPTSIQSDIKSIWASYRAAQTEGEKFLFGMGNPDLVRAAYASVGFGKVVASEFYLHRSVEDEMPALLRLLIFAARQIVGEVAYDVLKIAQDGRVLSFLSYPDFDVDPHPALHHRVRVYLPKAAYDIRGYDANPPILHRKDTLVAPSYPHYEKFRRLTEEEEAHGLLSLPNIGYRTAWLQLLQEKGLAVRDHEVVDL